MVWRFQAAESHREKIKSGEERRGNPELCYPGSGYFNTSPALALKQDLDGISLLHSMLRFDSRIRLRQRSSAIENKLKAQNAPYKSITCLSLVLYGMRVPSKPIRTKHHWSSTNESGEHFRIPRLASSLELWTLTGGALNSVRISTMRNCIGKEKWTRIPSYIVLQLYDQSISSACF